jgi:hypothetical protein
VNEAVLAELREIRTEIHTLTEQLGKAATREDLKLYVTQASFDHHIESHNKGVENWRTWLPWAVTIVITLFELFSGHMGKLLGGG